MIRTFHPRPARIIFGVAALALSGPSWATIPPPVEAMIREAARSGDKATVDAVVKVATATNPDDAEAIATLAAQQLKEAQTRAEEAQRQKIAAQHFFQGWSGEGQVGFGLSSGNTSETSAVVGVTLRKKGLHTRHELVGLVDYLRTNGVTTRQKYGLNYSLDYVLSKRLYLVGTLGWERDWFAGYARRFTESAGVGYRAIDARSMKLDIEAAPALRQTKLIDGTSSDEFAGRASLAYRWTIRDGFLFSEDGSVVSGDNDTTLISTSALTAKINGKLSGRLSFNAQRETNPPTDRKSVDTATRFTLVYNF